MYFTNKYTTAAKFVLLMLKVVSRLPYPTFSIIADLEPKTYCGVYNVLPFKPMNQYF